MHRFGLEDEPATRKTRRAKKFSSRLDPAAARAESELSLQVPR